MADFTAMSFEELLREGGFACSCGKHHATDLKVFKSGAGVLDQLPEALKQQSVAKPFVVCDKNTYRAAGERVEALLKQAGMDYTLFMLPMEKVEPDETAVGSITMAYVPDSDMILAVGSGVINDICKVAAHAIGVRQGVVCTAPSMDGYASNSSSMHVNGVKCTLYNACPSIIIADSRIIAQAPLRMLWSGLGDMLAKYVSVCEWRIAHLVIGEYYCESIAALMRKALKRIMENAQRLNERDPAVIQAVTEGLVLSGVAMSFAQVSRPASGLEHYFSHMWEMMAMERHTHADFHGIQVGVGTLKTLNLYEWIRRQTPDRARGLEAMRRFDPQKWEEMVRRIFGSTAPQILAIEEKAHKNDPVKHAQRLDRIVEGWNDILKIIDEELPPVSQIEHVMKTLGMPMYPADLGISAEDTRDAFIGSREIRDKYLSSSMLWDMGLMEEAAKIL